MIGQVKEAAVSAALAVLAVSAPSAAPEEFLGVLIPRQEVNLVPTIEGRIARVFVRIGDRVERGAVVAEIDEQPLVREVDQAKARLDEANAARAEAATKLTMAEEALRRVNALIQDQIVARQQVRNAEQERDLARSALQMAEARVEQQRADGARLEDRLANAKMLAPFTGTVAQRFVNPGSMVGPKTPVIRLIASELLWARFALPLDRSGEVRSGARVRISVPDLGVETRGTVQQVSSEVDPASGMIFCEAVVEPPTNWAGPPLAGQTIRVSVEH